jgi:hypothetical protein
VKKGSPTAPALALTLKRGQAKPAAKRKP